MRLFRSVESTQMPNGDEIFVVSEISPGWFPSPPRFRLCKWRHCQDSVVFGNYVTIANVRGFCAFSLIGLLGAARPMPMTWPTSRRRFIVETKRIVRLGQRRRTGNISNTGTRQHQQSPTNGLKSDLAGVVLNDGRGTKLGTPWTMPGGQAGIWVHDGPKRNILLLLAARSTSPWPP